MDVFRVTFIHIVINEILGSQISITVEFGVFNTGKVLFKTSIQDVLEMIGAFGIVFSSI
jgi:hypothetical protein